jgi:carboxyl-terminal processing protease
MFLFKNNHTLIKSTLLFLSLTLLPQCEAKLPEITSKDVTEKTKEIMGAHATYKSLNPEIAKRILQNYLEELDPNKTYLIASEIKQWTDPSDELINRLIADYDKSNFTIFNDIFLVQERAIYRRRELEKSIDLNHLPKEVKASEFKKPEWAANQVALLERLTRLKALQVEASSKLNDEVKDKTLQRITKYQKQTEEEILVKDPIQRERLLLSNILKAMAASLDSNTVYFTPGEASQFLIHVQQRLFGIGAQLQDDIIGFKVIKNVPGGPADRGKELKEKDVIIAVNGEPVVGMNINDAVELIRGEENTPVVLTVIRNVAVDSGGTEQQKLDVKVVRGEVVLKESRYKSAYEPFADGVIGYVKLFSFYQDKGSSSALDLEKEISKLNSEHNLLGVILDLRYNTGGLLTQAVDVCSLFMSKGVVVSIKDEKGRVQKLRNIDGTMAWDGPLIILVNRSTASASEIVAQTLLDYGLAIVVGDDRTYGKGSYQTFTLSASEPEAVNPKGEYKVTRGAYYPVAGKTPQLTGVCSQVVVPGSISEEDIGEKFSKYPLLNDEIKPAFKDDLSDVPLFQRDRVERFYRYGMQEPQKTYAPYLDILKQNSAERVSTSANYQNFIKELKKKDNYNEEEMECFGQTDLQLDEAYQIMKDLIFLMHEKGVDVNIGTKKNQGIAS